MTEAAVTVDGFLDRRLAIRQPARGAHRAGLDAVLLAAAVPEESEGVVVDLGAGVGVAGLAVAARIAAVRIALVERDGDAAALARRNAAENEAAVGDRVRVIEADVRDADALARSGLGQHAAQVVLFNPPFHPAERVRASPSAARAAAHVAEADDLVQWMKAAARLTHPQGLMLLIHRADELPRILEAIGPRFGSLSMLPIQPRADAPAHRVLVAGRPQGRAPFSLRPPLVLHGGDGRFLPQAEAVMRGAGLGVRW